MNRKVDPSDKSGITYGANVKIRDIVSQRHVLLLLLALLLFVAHCWGDVTLEPSLVLEVVTSLFLGALVFSFASESRSQVHGISFFVVLLFLLSWRNHFYDIPDLELLEAILATIVYSWSCIFGIAFLMRQISSSFDDLCSAFSIYLLIGFTFSSLFKCVQLVSSGSFHAGHLPVSNYSQLLYFSMSNLATLGYGDVTATSPFAQALSVIESIIGQFYIAVIVARLVALHILAIVDKNNYS